MDGWSVFDSMRDRGIERVWLRLLNGKWRRVGALPDATWQPLVELDPALDALLDTVTRELRGSIPQRIEFIYRAEVGLRLIRVEHRPEAGRTLGTLRRLEFTTGEKEALTHASRVARMMTTRAWIAGAQSGGSALVMHGPAIPDYNLDPWIDILTQEIELCGAVLSVDSGFSPELRTRLGAACPAVAGARGRGAAATAAAGVHAAARATVAALGKAPGEATFTLQGLGQVGAEVARLLAADGAKLVVTDRDLKSIDRFLDGLSALERKLVSVLAPYQILDVESDVFCPNAQSGVITSANADGLKCRAIVGAADAVLLADGMEDERRLAAQLFRHGVLYVPDWLTGAGSAVHVVLESKAPEAFDERAALARTQRLCGWLTDDILQASKRSGHSPFDVVVERFNLDADGRPHRLIEL